MTQIAQERFVEAKFVVNHLSCIDDGRKIQEKGNEREKGLIAEIKGAGTNSDALSMALANLLNLYSERAHGEWLLQTF